MSKIGQFMHRSSILLKHYCSVRNQHIKELIIDLFWEISLANQNKYANTNGPIDTISIDFATLLMQQLLNVLCNTFRKIFSHKRILWLLLEKLCRKFLQNRYVETCKFKNRHFGICIFHYFNLIFDSKHISGVNILGGIFGCKLCRKIFFKVNLKWKNNLSRNCPKMVIRKFAILTVDVSNN